MQTSYSVAGPVWIHGKSSCRGRPPINQSPRERVSALFGDSFLSAKTSTMPDLAEILQHPGQFRSRPEC